MAPTVTTSPARVGPSVSSSQTTAAFDAPAGSVLVACATVDTSGTTNSTITVDNSGTGLTWVEAARRGGNESGARPGTVGIYVATVPSARTGMTVTMTSSITGRNTTLKVYVLTDVDTADPIGATLEGSASVGTNVLNTTSIVTDADDSLVFVLANESEVGPGEPSSSNTTIDPYVASGSHSGASGYRSGGSAGSSISFNVDAAGTSSSISWNWVAVEIHDSPIPAQTITVTGIPTAEAFGSPSLTVGGVIAPTAIPSAEAFGAPALAVGAVSLAPAGILSAEAFGTAQVQLSITAVGIASAEAFGTPQITMRIGPVGIASAETFGAVTLQYEQDVTPAGIASAEFFGTPDLTVTLDPATRLSTGRTSRIPLYEVLVMARIPQPSGPPTLFDVDAIAWSKVVWASTLSRAQSSRITCARTSITEPVAQRLRDPLRLPTELWVLRNGTVVCAGPLLGILPQGRNEIELVGGGLMTYLQWMWLEETVRYDQVDQFAMAADMVNRWQALEFGHFGIDTSQVGTSGRLRDGSYERDEGHQVSRRIQELGARRDGFDAEVDPASRRLQLWYPQKGIDRSSGEDAIVFDARNIDDGNGMAAFGPGDVASESFGSGSSSGAESALWSHQPNPDLRAVFGRTGVFGSWSDVKEQATLDDHVAAQGAARSEPLRAPGRRVKVTADSDLSSYAEGDVVQYELDRELGIGGPFRIRSRQVEVVRPGTESVDLEFV